MKIRKSVVLFIVIIFAFASCNNKSDNESNTETIKYVKVETIDSGLTQNKMVFNGKIKEKSLTSLSFRVGGPLAKLTVESGDFVRAGQVIATIDKRDYELQVQTTKAQFTQIEGEYKRYKELVEKDKIPENTFEKIKSGYLMAQTAYENAQNQLKDTELKAPFSGYVFEKFVENHQTVGPGAPIISLIDNSELEAVISVSESQVSRVRNDKESFLTVVNAGVKNLPVKLQSVSEKTLQDGLYEVKFSFSNNSKLNITPGMTAEVTMYCDAQNNSITIPGSAVFHEKTSDFVWVYNPSSKKVAKREIVISGVVSEGKAAVSSGVKSGEQLVTAGVHYLVDGQEVKPVKTPSVTNVGGLL